MADRFFNMTPRPKTSRSVLSRRDFCHRTLCSAGTVALACTPASSLGARETQKKFSLNYILGSPMYGTAPLVEVLEEVSKVGADVIDVWPRRHANHREQMDELGHDQVERLLDEHNVRLGMITRYDLRPHRLQEEMPVLSRFGGKLLVCGAGKEDGDSVKERVRNFVDSMHEQVVEAEKRDIKIGIENHGGSLLSTPDSLRYFADFIKTEHLGLAMAPYHLPQDPELIADLIAHLGNKLVFFQAWQHGKGCMDKLPKEEELLQLPGRGALDFTPVLAALQRIDYRGWTEIFMHPVPRGIPILPTTAEVSREINTARSYLETCLASNAHLETSRGRIP